MYFCNFMENKIFYLISTTIPAISKIISTKHQYVCRFEE